MTSTFKRRAQCLEFAQLEIEPNPISQILARQDVARWLETTLAGRPLPKTITIRWAKPKRAKHVR